MGTLRRIGLAAAVMIAAVGAAAPTPASAGTAYCAGVWHMTTGAGFFLPGLGSSTYTTSFNMDGGTCVPSHGAYASGTISGTCDRLSGTGQWAGYHFFTFQSVGSVVLFTGQVIGVMHIAPEALNGHSCFSGARTFLLEGGVYLA